MKYLVGFALYLDVLALVLGFVRGAGIVNDHYDRRPVDRWEGEELEEVEP